MMKIFLICLCLFAFISCRDTIKKNNLAKNEIENAITQAELSDELIKEVFLKFKFGMSQEDVTSHFQELLKQKIIYLDSDNSYTYNFITKNGVLKTTFSTQFFKNKLYCLTLKFSKGDDFLFDSPNLMMQLALDTFQPKAQSENYNFYIDKILDKEVYYYIKNNVIIKFSSTIEPMMVYTNAPMEKLKDLESISKTVDDF